MIKTALRQLAIVVGAFLIAAAFNIFLIPHQLLSAGVSGVSMLIGYGTGMNISLLYFLLNVPILIWGWISIGKRFVTYSIVSVIFTTLFMQWVPENPWLAKDSLFVTDPILAAIFGGVMVGIGTGISLRAGGSTAGFDIIGFILSKKKDLPLGTILFALNAIVVVALAFMLKEEGSDAALYSMLSIFVTGKIVDMIHIRHIKVTVFIVTCKTKEIKKKLLKRPRGITVINTRGAYTNEEREMLMTVTTRYELAELKKMIKDADPDAFVNIVETVGIMGQFQHLDPH
ncbi:YitT family protein [Longirhabdus pacifica]|uniref:YitT family protein n=1 Tax=Longirhabdus pacifica TaxID=2305227 RepID=UPI0010087A07|nr:YitT family protein [Longirhabdus pacifica]